MPQVLLAKRKGFLNVASPLCFEILYLYQYRYLPGWPVTAVALINGPGQAPGFPASLAERIFEFTQPDFEAPVG